MNQLPRNKTTAGSDTALSARLAPPLEEIAMLLCARDGQLQSFTETILLVEDEAFVREVAGEILRSAGYRILRARSTEEALKAYRGCGGEIDLLLSDVVLPGESGPSFAKKLRGENPAMKTLFMTGYIENIKYWKGVNWEDCLRKPFTARELLERVRRVLDERGNPGGRVFRHAAGSA